MTIIIFLLFISCSIPKKDCNSIKSGTFKSVMKLGDFPPVVTFIERKGDIQYERTEEMGLEVKYKVEWINDCSYKLIWMETIKARNNFGVPKELITTHEIIQVTPEYYSTSVSANLFSKKFEMKIERVENNESTTPKKH